MKDAVSPPSWFGSKTPANDLSTTADTSSNSVTLTAMDNFPIFEVDSGLAELEESIFRNVDPDLLPLALYLSAQSQEEALQSTAEDNTGGIGKGRMLPEDETSPAPNRMQSHIQTRDGLGWLDPALRDSPEAEQAEIPISLAGRNNNGESSGSTHFNTVVQDAPPVNNSTDTAAGEDDQESHAGEETQEEDPGSASTTQTGFKPKIKSEASYKEKLASLRPVYDPTKSDYPEDQETQLVIISSLYDAIRNTTGILDSATVGKLFSGDKIPDEAIEMVCWEVMLGARDAQVRSLVGQHYNNKYQEFPSFYDRLMKIIESLTVSKALCKMLLDPHNVSRIVDNPAAELKKKGSNKDQNNRKTALVKAGIRAMAEEAEAARKRAEGDLDNDSVVVAQSVDDDAPLEDEEPVNARRRSARQASMSQRPSKRTRRN